MVDAWLLRGHLFSKLLCLHYLPARQHPVDALQLIDDGPDLRRDAAAARLETLETQDIHPPPQQVLRDAEACPSPCRARQQQLRRSWYGCECRAKISRCWP
jgi:hypothetical protein